MPEVRPRDLAIAHLGDREVRGEVTEVRDEPHGHQRAIIDEIGGDEQVNIGTDRVEVVR